MTAAPDPLGGSEYIEKLTDDIERGAEAYIARIDKMGGTLRAIEEGFIQREIQNAAYEYQKKIETGEAVVVGVNRFEEAAIGFTGSLQDRPRHRAAASGARPRTARLP